MRRARSSGVWLLIGVACGLTGLAILFGVSGASAAAAKKRPKPPPAINGITLTTKQVIRALAREGVGVYRSPSDTRPVVPVTAPAVALKVLYPQAVIYAAETKSHSGTLGSALNSVVPMPKAPHHKVYPGFDYLLAAYADSTATRGEVLAGRLLGHKDLAQARTIVFPDLIQTLMTADALRAADRGGSSTKSASPDVADGGSLCSALSDWVSHAYNSVFNALTVGSSSNATLNFIGGLWNQAVNLAKGAISNIASLLTGHVIAAIRTAVATAGVIAWAVSTLRNLQVTKVVGNPSYNSFGVDPQPGNKGTVTATLGIPGGWNWPSGVQDCAQLLLGHNLPSLNSVAGRKVKWKLSENFTVPTDTWCATGSDCYLAKKKDDETDSSLASDHTTKLTYQTNTESANQHQYGDLIRGDSILVQGTISLDTDQLKTMIKDIVLGAVPGAVKIVAGPLVDELTTRVAGLLSSISQPKFFRYVLIEHHAKLTLPPNDCTAIDMAQDFPPPPAAASWAPDLASLRSVEAPGPGAISSTGCTVTTYAECSSGGNGPCPDGYHCSSSENCQPLGFYDLWVFETDRDAKTGFKNVRDALASEGTKWEDVDIGNQAVVNKDGASGVVRAENDVFFFGWLPHWSDDPSPEAPLQDAINQLCYGCTY